MSEYQQVFILGAPRSGTTFLASLLDKTIYGKPVETHFITKYYKRLEKYGDIKNRDVLRSLVDDILKERPVQQWGIRVEFEGFYQSLPKNYSYSDVVNQLMSLQKQGVNPFAWGDKTPHYVGDLDILMNLFPDAKYIYIVRDGRDVALSLLEKNWGPNNVYECAEYWSKLNRNADLIHDMEKEGKIYSLTYENLVDHTADHVREVYRFLGSTVSDQEVETLSSTVIARNYGKWKAKMTAGEIKTFEAVAGSCLNKLGYELMFQGSTVPAYRKLAYTIHSKYRRLYFLFYTNVIDGFKIRFLGKAPFDE